MNTRGIRTLAAKDLRVALSNRIISVPMIVLPVLLLVVMPGVTAWALLSLPEDQLLSEVGAVIEALPPSLAPLMDMPLRERAVAVMMGYMLAPLYLIVPLMVASVLGAESFAGEKERGTIEALVYLPLTTREILLAKTAAAVLPAIGVGLGGAVLYIGTVYGVASRFGLSTGFFPFGLWLVMALWVVPALAVFSLGVMVIISMRVRTFMEAFQLGGLVVLPVVALLIAQAAGTFFLSPWAAIIVGAVVWGLNGALAAWVNTNLLKGDLLLAME